MPAETTPAPPDTSSINTLFASGAATAAQLLIDHDGPPLGGISLDMLGLDPATPSPVRVNLQISRTQPLTDFLAWTDLLAEVDDQAHTIVTPRAGYLSLDTYADYHDLRVVVWTHLSGQLFRAVWNQLDPPPSVEDSVAISVQSLRDVAEVST